MGNKEDLKKCPEYADGKAGEYSFLGEENKLVFCNAEVCPYNKEISTTFGENRMIICNSKGLLKKTELDKPDTDKRSNKPKVYPPCDLEEIGDFTKIDYRQLQTKQPESQLSP